MEDNVIDIADLDKEIYRIFSIDRFKELLINKELVLSSPFKWDDPFENFFLKAGAIDEQGKPTNLQNIAESWYGQCWTFNIETDPMWRIYTCKKQGVRVSSTIRKLFSCLWDDSDKYAGLKYFIGRVCYKPRTEIEEIMEKHSFWDMANGGQNDRFAKLLFMKRLEFSHENEVRTLVNDTVGTKGDKGYYRIMFDYQSVFEDICIDPRLDDKEYQRVKNDIQSMGCTLPITQSELYKVNFSPIRLV